ncbi:MAG: aspartate aminotransferase family protein [Caldilineaceae bacterium SB0668_bin_21]|nr:aspartate aminotransferase family protein [Caldilineaceae bacterium SB0668_bin_21]MYC20071.1 aspartate aminotransferase family protein [Caldilineaceae bacterium SB0662_bin_25]
MSSNADQVTANTIVQTFKQRTQGSQEWDARAKKSLPGGDTRASSYYTPYPAYMVRGEGCYLYDLDENRYIDFLNNYTSLIHGHAHPATVSAIQEQAARGTVLGSAAEVTVEHAEMLCSRVPSLESVRYCNSGTEATHLAMRAARAFTGKDVIVKMDGGYHGSHDYVQVNVKPDTAEEGLPRRRLTTRGVPAAVVQGMQVVPFNDLDALEDLLRAHSGEVAAIILEPVLGSGGGVEPQPGYLRGVRQLADTYDVLLIFDEILTFRLDVGGIQSAVGVTPDLTSVAKFIGGGLPLGAFGGRQEIMAPFDPTHPQTIPHNGTFNGNNVAMAAGLATMKAYGAGEVAQINELGQRLKDGFNRAFQTAGVRARAAGLGSIIPIHWSEGEIRTARDAVAAQEAARNLPKLLHMEMMNRGIFSAPRGQFTVSTPMTAREIDTAVKVMAQSLKVVKPYMVEHTPHLLRD